MIVLAQDKGGMKPFVNANTTTKLSGTLHSKNRLAETLPLCMGSHAYHNHMVPIFPVTVFAGRISPRFDDTQVWPVQCGDVRARLVFPIRSK